MKIYSYFLPQFYPTPENDKFWGEGFTDWVSTRNAISLFEGHNQPFKPLDLGYYDLSKEDEAKSRPRRSGTRTCDYVGVGRGGRGSPEYYYSRVSMYLCAWT